jgi:hypothetical protein
MRWCSLQNASEKYHGPLVPLNISTFVRLVTNADVPLNAMTCHISSQKHTDPFTPREMVQPRLESDIRGKQAKLISAPVSLRKHGKALVSRQSALGRRAFGQLEYCKAAEQHQEFGKTQPDAVKTKTRPQKRSFSA